MMRRSVGLAVVLLMGCGGSPEPWRELGRVDGRTEIFVVPTLHRTHQRSERFPLHLLAQMIRAAQPTAVLAEVPPARFEQIQVSATQTTPDEWLVHFPEVRVALTVSAELDVPLLPISGWKSEVSQRLREFEPPRDDGYQRAAQQFERADEDPDDPEWVVSPRYRRLTAWLDRATSTYAASSLGPADPLRVCEAHASLIVRTVEARPPQRYALVFDARRRWCLEQKLRAAGFFVGDPRALLESVQ